MRILVIGGTYFCGKAFVELASREHAVSILNRGNRPLTLTGGRKVTQYTADRHDAAALAGLNLPSFDAVVDFCAYSQGDISSMLEALKGKIRQYIFISTCDVYPHISGGLYDEESEYETEEFPGEEGAYISGKVALEQELKIYCEAAGVAYTSFRPTMIYGPDNYAPRENVFFSLIKRENEIPLPVDATGRFQFVFTGDVAAAALAACGNSKAYNRAFNLTGSTETYASFTAVLEKATGLEFRKNKMLVADIRRRQLSLPFPLTEEETILYVGDRVQELGVRYTAFEEGMRLSYHRYCEYYNQKVLAKIDSLFDENKAEEAEHYMREELSIARASKDLSMQLSLHNELIGYYRQKSEEFYIERHVTAGLRLVEQMGLTGTISHATTALNAANAYRSVGRYEESLALYRVTASIYKEQMDKNDMRYSGLLNNVSLLFQEMGKYEKALELQKQAYEIAKNNNAGFEIAVGLSNMANTYVALRKYETAASYAERAIAAFRERNCLDAHYCAALSALGMCSYHRGDYDRAIRYFEDAMEIVKGTLGENLQYEKLKQNRDRVQAAKEGKLDTAEESIPEEKEDRSNIKGIDLCREYYETVGKPMLREKFGDYLDRIAAGLVGEGSDCYKLDDEISRDHDWGPSFCLWVNRETYEKIGKELEEAYAGLPREFKGFKVEETAQADGRRGVHIIEEFYAHFLGTADCNAINWSAVEDYALAAATNGEVFEDPLGEFTKIRTQLRTGYPESILYLKLAEDVARFSQTAQYNNLRMLRRGDLLTSKMMTAQGVRQAMLLLHHACNVYPPHDKWLRSSTLALPQGQKLVRLLEGLMNAADEKQLKELGDRVGSLIANILYEQSLISDIDSYIGVHAEELADKAEYSRFSDGELVERIAKLEFEAFDKVKNEGGRAYCQNDWPTFSIMRKSQYLTWNRTMLLQYLYDFNREYKAGHNLITEKYGRMMASTDTKRYAELEPYFPELTEEKKAVIEQIVAIQMNMVEAFAEVHPKAAGNARNLHTYEDDILDTSYETYLRGEISTYSDKMLQLYGRYVVECLQGGINIAEKTIGNTAILYGYKSIDELEQYM